MFILFWNLDNTLINNGILSQKKYAWSSPLRIACLSSTIFSISGEFVLLNMGVCFLFPIFWSVFLMIVGQVERILFYLRLIEMRLVILLGKSGDKEIDEYNHFWRCYLWERGTVSILKFNKLM